MKNSLIILLPLLAWSFESHAIQFKETAPDGEIEAIISIDDISRIKVIADGITSLKINEGQLETLYEEVSGDVFIRPSLSSLDPMSAFITTKRGFTYKILLTPESVPAEQIFIHNSEAVIASVAIAAKRDSYEEQIIVLIDSMRKSKPLEGYVRKEASIPLFAKTKMQILQSTYTGRSLQGSVYQYRNTSKDPMILSAETFKEYDLKALSLDKDHLEPGDTATVYIVKEKENGKNT